MPFIVQWPASMALIRRLEAIRAAAGPDSRQSRRCMTDIQILVEQDHEDKMLRGVDRYGQPRAGLAESTEKKRRANPNSLIPHGYASRFIQCFQTAWQDGVLVGQFVDMVNKQGQPFAHYHLTGCPIGSKARQPNWSLPRRDVSGITPKGWVQIVKRHKEFAEDVRGAQGAA